jgi:hypothetical protein
MPVGVHPDRPDRVVDPTLRGVLVMLETIAILLVILWALGFFSAYTMGGFIHVLLVLAAVVILVRLIQGRRI